MAAVPVEAVKEQHSLKATFVFNQLRGLGFFDLYETAKSVVEPIDSKLDWSFSKEGIDKNTATKIKELGLPLALFFCHPTVIAANPRLVAYYRCISAMSRKALKTISSVSSVDKMEKGLSDCNSTQALKIAKTLNHNLRLIYNATTEMSAEKTKGVMYATFGATIDGSWKNAIGSEGERVVRFVLIDHLLKEGDLVTVTIKDGSILKSSQLSTDWIDLNAGNLKSAAMKNGSQVIFSSEPDITCMLADGSVTAGVEVKAGLDPAGALERLGAMKKSFQEILYSSSKAETILVASCITPEVQRRLNADANVRRVMDLNDIISKNGNVASTFCNILRENLKLT